MNKNEYGIDFNLNVNFDLSANTSLSLEITKPNGATITVVPTVGTVLLATNQFAANQYSVYRFVQGDIDQAGTYSARLTYNAAGPTRLISDVATFTVNP